MAVDSDNNLIHLSIILMQTVILTCISKLKVIFEKSSVLKGGEKGQCTFCYYHGDTYCYEENWVIPLSRLLVGWGWKQKTSLLTEEGNISDGQEQHSLLLQLVFDNEWFSEPHVVCLMSACYGISIETNEIEVTYSGIIKAYFLLVRSSV